MDAIRSSPNNGAQQVIITKLPTDRSTLIICNNCNHAISKRASGCPKCGYTLTTTCNICRATIPKSSVTCPECGDSDPFEKPSERQVEKIGHSVKRVEHIEADDFLNQVILKKTHNGPKGVGGWLLLLVAHMMSGSVLDVIFIRGYFDLAEGNLPHLINLEAWNTYKRLCWITFGIAVSKIFFGGWKLLKTHKWSSVTIAMVALVITGPVGTLFAFFINVSLGIIEINSIMFISLIVVLIPNFIWMSYLSRSKRVRNTYIKNTV